MKLTKRQAQVISAYTGFTLCDFKYVHEYIEELLERPVLIHELASEELQEIIQEKSKADLMNICYKEEEQ